MNELHIITNQMPLPEVPVAPPIEPAMPSARCETWLALLDLAEGTLTTLDWVVTRINWKLGDAVLRLRKLGWHVDSELVTTAEGRKTELYWLTPAHLQLAKTKLEATK